MIGDKRTNTDSYSLSSKQPPSWSNNGYDSILIYIWGTAVILNLQFRTKSGKKSLEKFTLRISLNIFSKESRVGNPASTWNIGKWFVIISNKIHWIFIHIIFHKLWCVILQLLNFLLHFHIDNICVFINIHPIFHNDLHLITGKIITVFWQWAPQWKNFTIKIDANFSWFKI